MPSYAAGLRLLFLRHPEEAANGSGPKWPARWQAPRPSKGDAAKSAIADSGNYGPKSEYRFRLAVHPSRLASLAPQD